ncbi:spermidine/putrescine ABC transporter substrate-binding protein [Clostridia bacterium]|nr:spermidine/putrescine ABC transporter substrate-binding protein [Clostridia bacterium]
MKKLVFAALILLLTACGNAGEPSAATAAKAPEGKLYIYNWGDYIDPELITRFTDETGIKVTYDEFDTNESMYAKLKPGNSNYDLIIPSDYMLEKMQSEGMLLPIDMDNVPNAEYIDRRVEDKYFGTGVTNYSDYAVPYMWGTLGILYNTTMVDETVDSWDILWDEKYADEIYMYDSQRDSLTPALVKLGYSINTTNLDELNAAKDLLIAQKPLVQAYLGDQVKDKMIGGEAALALVFSGDAVFCAAENPDLAFAVPKEGSNVWLDAMAIPVGSLNKENAEKFINFMCDPEVAAQNSEYIGFTTTNAEALKYIPDELKNTTGYIPPDDVFETCEFYRDLKDFLKEYDRAWTELLAR